MCSRTKARKARVVGNSGHGEVAKSTLNGGSVKTTWENLARGKAEGHWPRSRRIGDHWSKKAVVVILSVGSAMPEKYERLLWTSRTSSWCTTMLSVRYSRCFCGASAVSMAGALS